MARIFLGGGFFNPEQVRVTEQLEALVEALGHVGVSPRRDIGKLEPDGGNARSLFERDVIEIRGSDVFLARVDDWDPGTMWELGMIWQARRPLRLPRIVGYTVHAVRGLNLMLSQGVDGFLRGWEDIEQFLGYAGQLNLEALRKWKPNL